MFSHYCYSLADPHTHAHSNSSSPLWAERGAMAGTHRRPVVCRDYKNRLGLSKSLISPPFLHCFSQNKHIISRACWGLLATEKERKIERDGERERKRGRKCSWHGWVMRCVSLTESALCDSWLLGAGPSRPGDVYSPLKYCRSTATGEKGKQVAFRGRKSIHFNSGENCLLRIKCPCRRRYQVRAWKTTIWDLMVKTWKKFLMLTEAAFKGSKMQQKWYCCEILLLF